MSTVCVWSKPASAWSKLVIKTAAAARGEALSDQAAGYIAKCARGRGMGPAAYVQACYAAIDLHKAERLA